MVNVLEQAIRCTKMKESEGKNIFFGNLVATSAEFLRHRLSKISAYQTANKQNEYRNI
jgi:hypothetical protein